MSLAACAELVARADPDRFRAAMAAPVAARRVLFPLYAFNVEVTRAPWVTAEPMIAEMRLQWWRDALAEIGQGGPVRTHEVTDALAPVLDAEGAEALDDLVAARRWDCYRDGFADEVALDAYLDATSGNLMWTAARRLGAADPGPVRDVAFAQGVAQFLRAAPELEARGRRPLVDGTPAGIAALARRALARLDAGGRALRRIPAAARPALYPAATARPILQAIAKDPAALSQGRLSDVPGPLTARLRLLAVSQFGTRP